MKTYYAIKNKRYVATECESFQELFNELWDSFVLSHSFEDVQDEAEAMLALSGKLESDEDYLQVIQNLDSEIDVLEKENKEDGEEPDEDDDDIEIADDGGLFQGSWQSHRDEFILGTVCGYINIIQHASDSAQCEHYEELLQEFLRGMDAIMWDWKLFRYDSKEKLVEVTARQGLTELFDIYQIDSDGYEHIATARRLDGDMPYDKVFTDENGFTTGFSHATGWEKNFGDGFLAEYVDSEGRYHYGVAEY